MSEEDSSFSTIQFFEGTGCYFERTAYRYNHLEKTQNRVFVIRKGRSCTSSVSSATGRFSPYYWPWRPKISDQRWCETSTQLWWSILRSGHRYVAVLDGGWLNWIDGGYEVRRDSPLIPPTKFRSNPDVINARLSDGPRGTLKLGPSHSVDPTATFDVRRLQGKMGLLPAEEILSYLQERGLETRGVYAVEGSSQQIAFLIFVLHLLGHSTLTFDLDSGLLSFDQVAGDR